MNTTDMLGLDTYSVSSESSDLRGVYYTNDKAYKELLEAKPLIPVIQIFDMYCLNRTETGKPAPPSFYSK